MSLYQTGLEDLLQCLDFYFVIQFESIFELLNALFDNFNMLLIFSLDFLNKWIYDLGQVWLLFIFR